MGGPEQALAWGVAKGEPGQGRGLGRDYSGGPNPATSQCPSPALAGLGVGWGCWGMGLHTCEGLGSWHELKKGP